MLKLLFLFSIFFSVLNSSSIGTIVKGKIDKFEHSYALVERLGQVISVEKIGFKLNKKDKIKTFRRSHIQIKLLDDTIIKIGKKTTLKIEQYIYGSQNKSKNAVNLKIENGSYQIKTGKIGDQAPKNFKIKTKFSTIGLRGWKNYLFPHY